MKFGFKYGTRISMYLFDEAMNKTHQTRQVGDDYSQADGEIIIDVYESDPALLERQKEVILENKDLYDRLYLEDLMVEMYVRESTGDPSTASIEGLFHLRNRIEGAEPGDSFEQFLERASGAYRHMHGKP